MTVVPLELVPDPDDPQLMSCLVDVAIDGEPRRALLDSGAARSALRRRPGLVESAPRAGGSGVFGASVTGRGHAAVRVGFAGHDLGVLPVDVLPEDHPGPGDLVGQDVLKRWRCEYRLGEALLVIDAPPVPDGLPLHVGARGHVTVEVRWASGLTAQAVLDTGASITVVHEGFVTAHPDLFEAAGITQGTDADGTTVQTPLVAMAAGTVLGGPFAASAAAVVDLTAAVASAEAHFDMILGWPVLRQGTFVVDHANRRGRYRPAP